MTLDILVDYDNLSFLDKRRGLINIVIKVISTLAANELQGKTNARIRLYGGWYEGGSLTRKAQDIAIDIASNFPYLVTSPTTGVRLIVNIELAYSLLITPQEHLLDTYRIRSFPKDLHCLDPLQKGCMDSACAIRNIHTFINQGACSNKSCSIRPSDIIYRGSQKMVDTMLISDLFFLSMNSSNPIVIVSSDDDCWPGIRTVLALGNQLIHLQTRQYHSLSALYKQHISTNYTEKHI